MAKNETETRVEWESLMIKRGETVMVDEVGRVYDPLLSSNRTNNKYRAPSADSAAPPQLSTTLTRTHDPTVVVDAAGVAYSVRLHLSKHLQTIERVERLENTVLALQGQLNNQQRSLHDLRREQFVPQGAFQAAQLCKADKGVVQSQRAKLDKVCSLLVAAGILEQNVGDGLILPEEPHEHKIQPQQQLEQSEIPDAQDSATMVTKIDIVKALASDANEGVRRAEGTAAEAKEMVEDMSKRLSSVDQRSSMMASRCRQLEEEKKHSAERIESNRVRISQLAVELEQLVAGKARTSGSTQHTERNSRGDGERPAALPRGGVLTTAETLSRDAVASTSLGNAGKYGAAQSATLATTNEGGANTYAQVVGSETCWSNTSSHEHIDRISHAEPFGGACPSDPRAAVSAPNRDAPGALARSSSDAARDPTAERGPIGSPRRKVYRKQPGATGDNWAYGTPLPVRPLGLRPRSADATPNAWAHTSSPLVLESQTSRRGYCRQGESGNTDVRVKCNNNASSSSRSASNILPRYQSMPTLRRHHTEAAVAIAGAESGQSGDIRAVQLMQGIAAIKNVFTSGSNVYRATSAPAGCGNTSENGPKRNQSSATLVDGDESTKTNPNATCIGGAPGGGSDGYCTKMAEGFGINVRDTRMALSRGGKTEVYVDTATIISDVPAIGSTPAGGDDGDGDRTTTANIAVVGIGGEEAAESCRRLKLVSIDGASKLWYPGETWSNEHDGTTADVPAGDDQFRTTGGPTNSSPDDSTMISAVLDGESWSSLRLVAGEFTPSVGIDGGTGECVFSGDGSLLMDERWDASTKGGNVVKNNVPDIVP